MPKNILTSEANTLNQQILFFQKKLKNMPPEHLFCTKNGNHYKWYVKNGTNPIYIPKKDRHFAETLALKKYYICRLNELELEARFLQQYSKTFEQSTLPSSLLLEKPSGYQELLQDYFKKQQQSLDSWIGIEAPGTPPHPENLIHETYSGNMVRSKSEVIISNALFVNNISFCYERSLLLGSTCFFPDFTILHPKTHKLYYWEHFGMMENPTYRNNAYQKLITYGDHDILPSVNLITTFETLTTPINSHKINPRNIFIKTIETVTSGRGQERLNLRPHCPPYFRPWAKTT